MFIMLESGATNLILWSPVCQRLSGITSAGILGPSVKDRLSDGCWLLAADDISAFWKVSKLPNVSRMPGFAAVPAVLGRIARR